MPLVQITTNTQSLVETQGTLLTFNFELSEPPPDTGVRVYVLGDVSQSLTQLDLFNISYSGGDAPVGDFDFTGFYFNIKSPSATVSLPIFSDGIAESPQTVVYTLQPGNDYTVDPIFSAIAVNFSDDAIVSGVGDDNLIGAAGNNTLNDGGEIDILIGATGNDTYVIDATTDTITENAGEGTDTIEFSTIFSLADQFTLGSGTFIANNDGIAGFNNTTGSIIEVPGLIGIPEITNTTI